MTPTEIITAARNKYNAVGDTFWSDDELLGIMYDACLEINKDANLIETATSMATVASQQDYAYPTRANTIKRITYNGAKLEPIDFRLDDQITGLNQATTSTGTPAYYYIWDETISLRPIPSSIGTLKIYTYDEPAVLLIGSTLEIPTRFHMGIVNYIVSEMASKDTNFQMADYYQAKFEKVKNEAVRFSRKKRRGDSFATVINEESHNE